MKNYRKTRPGEATPKRAEIGKQLGTAAIPIFNYSPHKLDGQDISNYLSYGAEHGVGLRDLVHITGLPDRVVRQMIQAERLDGVPILSDNASGYFLPGNKEEVGRCVASLRHRANEIFKTANAIEKAGNKLEIDGQISLDGC